MAHVDLSDHVIDVVFTIFDENCKLIKSLYLPILSAKQLWLSIILNWSWPIFFANLDELNNLRLICLIYDVPFVFQWMVSWVTGSLLLSWRTGCSEAWRSPRTRDLSSCSTRCGNALEKPSLPCSTFKLQLCQILLVLLNNPFTTVAKPILEIGLAPTLLLIKMIDTRKRVNFAFYSCTQITTTLHKMWTCMSLKRNFCNIYTTVIKGFCHLCILSGLDIETHDTKRI